MTAEETPDGEQIIRVAGEIDHLFGYNLSTLLDNFPEVTRIIIVSDGGILEEIYAPAARIQKRKITVEVEHGSYCISACAFLALYSPNIIIDGQMAFHRPYYTSFDMNMSLYDVSQTATFQTIDMSRNFFDTGWKLILYYVIDFSTSSLTYLVFEDEEELNKYRMTDPSQFTDEVASNEGFIRTSNQIILISAQQLLDNTK